LDHISRRAQIDASIRNMNKKEFSDEAFSFPEDGNNDLREAGALPNEDADSSLQQNTNLEGK
jgi:hypothetical protein